MHEHHNHSIVNGLILEILILNDSMNNAIFAYNMLKSAIYKAINNSKETRATTMLWSKLYINA